MVIQLRARIHGLAELVVMHRLPGDPSLNPTQRGRGPANTCPCGVESWGLEGVLVGGGRVRGVRIEGGRIEGCVLFWEWERRKKKKNDSDNKGVCYYYY